MRYVSYDIEALRGAATVTMIPMCDGAVASDPIVFVRVDGFLTPEAQEAIAKAAATTAGTPHAYVCDLGCREWRNALASFFGFVDGYTWDITPGYDPERDWSLVSYNGDAYDLNVIGYMLDGEDCPNATAIRAFNDALFAGIEQGRSMMQTVRNWDHAHRSHIGDIRDRILLFGRQLDLVNLIPGRRALKAIEAYKGLRIDEHALGDTAEITTLDELTRLVSYNVDDVIATGRIAAMPEVAGVIDARRAVIANNQVATRDSSGNVRPRRARVDSTAAQLVAAVVAPDGPIADRAGIDYTYGSAGIDVLETVKNAMADMTGGIGGCFDNFMSCVYEPYAAIRGRNTNESLAQGFGHASYDDLSSYETAPVVYYSPDGPATTYAAFGLGGVHGAEYDRYQWLHDVYVWNAYVDISNAYPDPIDYFRATGDYERAGGWQNVPVSEIFNGSLKYRRLKQPSLVTATGALSKKYRHTTVATNVIHADVSSWYPTMLRNMHAFGDGDASQRYLAIYNEKQRLGSLLKRDDLDDATRTAYKAARGADKLLLNSASGAMDTNFDTNLRANNSAQSMRIVGQLWLYMLAQRLSFDGARVFSTNTDGLYMDGIDLETVERRLSEWRKAAECEIEPEVLPLMISADSNNRIVFDTDGAVIEASGRSLGAIDGPTIAHAPKHPAIVDAALARYLYTLATTAIAAGDPDAAMDGAFDPILGRECLSAALEDAKSKGTAHALLMLSNVLVVNGAVPLASDGKEKPAVVTVERTPGSDDWHTVGRFRRYLAVADGTPDAVQLKLVTTRKGSDASDPDALRLLLAAGMPADKAESYGGAAWRKASGIDEDQAMLSIGGDLERDYTEDQRASMLASVDLTAYVAALDAAYTNTWRNN